MKRVLYKAVVGCGVAAMFAGCANWGATDPVLGGNENAYKPRLVASQPPAGGNGGMDGGSTAVAEAPQRGSRELAALRADLDALLEEQKRQTARIIGLEQDNMRKDEQIKELQALLDAMDKRFAEVDKNWQSRMGTLRESIDKESEIRRRQLEAITTEIDKGSQQPQVEYRMLEVQPGDSLSSLAKALKTTVAELKRINNLKDDRIYVNQKLKVPVNK